MSATDAAEITQGSCGEYRYSTPAGDLRAIEEWSQERFADGRRIARAHVRNFGPGSDLFVVHGVDADLRPRATSIVLWVNGSLRGALLATVQGGEFVARLTTPEGQIERREAVGDRFAVIAHPFSTGAWLLGRSLRDGPVGALAPVQAYLTEHDVRASVPLLGRLVEQSVERRADETVTVAAGTFAARHYVIGGAMHYWIEPRRLLIVRAELQGRMVYELARLTDRTSVGASPCL